MLGKKRKEDWLKIGLLMGLFCAIIFSVVLFIITSNVLFVKRIGADFLPYTYIAKAVVGLIVSMFLAAHIHKYNLSKTLQITSVFAIIFFISDYFLIQADFIYSYPLLVVLGDLFFMLITSVYMWEIAMKLCTPLEAKRTFGYISFGGSIGGILAGITSSFFSEKIGTENLILVFSATLGLTTLLAFIINTKFNKKLKAEEAKEIKESSIKTLKKGLEYCQKNNLIKLISLILIIFGIIRWIADFEFQKILGENYDEDQFSKIVGYVSIIENIILIFVFLFIQKYLLNKFGVIKTLVTAPTIVILPFISLLLFPIPLIACITKLIAQASKYSLVSSPVKLISSSIPHKIRSQINTILNSFTEALSTIIAGIGLILLTELLSDNWIIITGIILSILMIFLISKINKTYTKQLSKNLQSKDKIDVHNAIENFAEKSYKKVGVNELMKLINHKKLETETIRKIVFALGKIDNIKVIPSLLDLFEKYDITVKYSVVEAIHGFKDLNENLEKLPFTKSDLIETYQNIFINAEDPELKIFILKNMKDLSQAKIIKFLKSSLKTNDIKLKSQAIKAMKFFKDRGIIKHIDPYLKNENIELQSSTLIALWQFKELRTDLLKTFIHMIRKNDKDSVLNTLLIISKLKFTWEKKYCLEKLKDQDVEIKTMAALTLARLNESKGINILIDALIRNNELGIIVGRNLKILPEKIRNKIINKISSLEEKNIEQCINTLKRTYLNFLDEIKKLRNNSTIVISN